MASARLSFECPVRPMKAPSGSLTRLLALFTEGRRVLGIEVTGAVAPPNGSWARGGRRGRGRLRDGSPGGALFEATAFFTATAGFFFAATAGFFFAADFFAATAGLFFAADFFAATAGFFFAADFFAATAGLFFAADFFAATAGFFFPEARFLTPSSREHTR